MFPAFARAVGDVPSTTAYVTNGSVSSIVHAPDGSTIIGGSFSKVGPQTGGGLILSDSDNGDPASATFPKVAGSVSSVISDGADGWFIGGTFTAVGSVAVNNLAHILSDGSIDPQWRPNPNQSVVTLALAGTNLFFGGTFTTVNGSKAQNYVAKVSTTGDGTVDATWNPNPSHSVTALAVSATDVFVGGNFSNVNGSSHPYLVKIPIAGDGTIDSSWNPSAQSSITALALSGTDLIVAGWFTYIGGQYSPRMAKISITGNGNADANWKPQPSSNVSALAVSGTDVYFGGDFTSTYNGTSVTRNRLAKTSTTGTGAVDATWDPNINGIVSSIAVSGGNVFIGGTFTTVNGSTAMANVAKLSATGTGTVDATWNPNPAQGASAVAAAGSKVYVGGSFGTAGSLVQTRNSLAKLNPDGTLDPTWNPNVGNGSVTSMALVGSSLYFAGYFTTVNGSTNRRCAAMTSVTGDGTVDPTWNPGPDNTVFSIVASGTDVFIGGGFNNIGGTSTRYLAKVSATTGAVDQSWAPKPDSHVQAMAISGSALYIGGSFQNVGTTTRRGIALVQTTGAGVVDAQWNPNVQGSVFSIVISKSTLYFGGYFNSISGDTTFPNLARTATTGDGHPDASWKPAPAGVNTLAIAGPWLYVGGSFNKFGGVTRNNLARTLLAGKGAADSSWDPNVTGTVYTVSPTSTSVAIGGIFTGAHGTPTTYCAQMALPVQAPAQLTATPATWDFLSRNVNTSVTKSFTITNTGGGELTLPPGALTLTGASAASFVLSNNTCEDTVLIGAPYDGSTCSFDVTFLPTLPLGVKSATLNIADDSAGNPHAIALTGTASYPVEVTVEQAGANCTYGGQQIEINPGDGSVSTTYVCNGGAGTSGSNGTDGASANVAVTAEANGANCVHGGQKIETSIGAGPVVTSYVCNGADGAAGADGLSPIVVAEGSGANCQYGGLKITSGDVDQFVCNGATGTDGQNGQDVTATTEAPGANCPAGGVKIVSADSTTYVCHGETALVKVTNEPAGEACPTGGQRIDSGLDKNANGTLDAGEITSTSFACNGATGGSGHNSLVKTDIEIAGANCAQGGTKISVGLDANDDDTLSSEETQSATYVCNGATGAAGPKSGCASAPAGWFALLGLLLLARRSRREPIAE